MSLETLQRPTRESILSDFTLTTSDAPGLVERALNAEGAKPAGDGEGDKPDTVDSESGDGSDPSVDAAGVSDDPGDESTPSNEDSSQADDDVDVDAEAAADTTDGRASSKRSNGIEKKFSRLTHERNAANARIAAIEAENQALKARLATPAPVVAPKPAEVAKVADVTAAAEKFTVKPAPKADDKDAAGNLKYASYADFIEATSRWSEQTALDATTHAEKRTADLVQAAVAKLQRDMEAKTATDRATSAAEQIKTAYEARAAKVRAANKDYAKLVDQNINQVGVTDIAKQIILTHERGPEVLLYLSRNPKESTRLNGLSNLDQSLAYGSIIAKIEAKSPGASKPSKIDRAVVDGEVVDTTKPKPPAAPLPRGAAGGNRGSGSGAPIGYKKAANMEFDDYFAGRRNGTIK